MSKTKLKRNQTLRRLQRKRAERAGRSSRKRAPAPPLAELPLVRCLLDFDILKGNGNTGLRHVLVVRKRPNGLLVQGSFLVDLYGTGIRDCFRQELSPMELEEWMDRYFPGPPEECSEETARQLVWGSHHYGKRSGFHPHPDFRFCKKLVPFLAPEAIDWSLFGYEGKPLIIGDYHDLLRRSRGRFNLDDPSLHYIVGRPAEEVGDPEPWEVLFEEDEGLPPGAEKLLFIETTYFGGDFEHVFEELSRWEDLRLDEVDREEDYARFVWTGPMSENGMGRLFDLPGARRILGHVTAEGGGLTVNVKGKSWALIMHERLRECFGDSLCRGSLSIEDPADLRDMAG